MGRQGYPPEFRRKVLADRCRSQGRRHCSGSGNQHSDDLQLAPTFVNSWASDGPSKYLKVFCPWRGKASRTPAVVRTREANSDVRFLHVRRPEDQA